MWKSTTCLLPFALPSLWLFTDWRQAAVNITPAAVCWGTEPRPALLGAAAHHSPAPRATAGPGRSYRAYPSTLLFQLGIKACFLSAGSTKRTLTPSAAVESQEKPGCAGKAVAASAASAQRTEKYLGRKAALLLWIAFCHENRLHDTRFGYSYLCQGCISQKAALLKRRVRISLHISSDRHCFPGWHETTCRVEFGITQQPSGCKEQKGSSRDEFYLCPEICTLLTLNCIKRKHVPMPLLQMNYFHIRCIQL